MADQTGLEIELKLALPSDEDRLTLLSHLPAPDAVIEQHNHYLCALDGSLAASKTMARVRSQRRTDSSASDPWIVLTVKRRRSPADDGLFIAQEHEERVAHDVWQRFKDQEDAEWVGSGPASSEVHAVCGPSGRLRVFGVMTNLRTVVQVEGFTLEIDRTSFPDGSVDTEVEVETDDPDGARVLLARLARDAGVSMTPQSLGKYARFLQRTAATSDA